MSKEVEEWRDIKGYEGLYQVSDWGRVKSSDRVVGAKNGSTALRKGRILKGNYQPYKYVVLVDSNKNKKPYFVHRLVAQAFIPNLEDKPVVGHIKALPDGTEDKTANEVWNIAWMTVEENNNYGTHNERVADAQRGIPKLKLRNRGDCSKKVYQYKNNELINEYPSVSEAARITQLSEGHISACCRGVRKMHGGYTWKYETETTN